MFSWRGQAAPLPAALGAPRAGDPPGHPQGVTGAEEGGWGWGCVLGGHGQQPLLSHLGAVMLTN